MKIELRFALVLLGTLAIVRTAIAEAPAFRTEDVLYRNGEVELAALLMLPSSKGRVPAAVIIQGSGASDRNNRWARAIAEELVHNGVAALLTDKRGSGASKGNWQTSGFGDLAADALAGVELLRARPEIDPDRVGLAGLSQGGWIAPLAAARSDRVAFVIDISGATVSFAEQSFVEMANTARQAGLSEAQVLEVLALNRAVARYLTTGDWEAYDRARKRALETPWRQIAAGFPGSPDLPIWTFFRQAAGYDPIPYWIQLTQPVLVVYGEDDERDNVPVRESVRRLEHAFKAAGKTNYRLLVVPGTGHSVMNSQGELMPAMREALAAWLREQVKSAGSQSLSAFWLARG
jgi:uncharacterized protein